MLEGNSYNDSCSKENNLHLQEKRLVCTVELLKKESVLERLQCFFVTANILTNDKVRQLLPYRTLRYKLRSPVCACCD